LGLTRQPLPNPAWSDAAVRYLCRASALCRSRSKSAVGAPHGIACIQMTIEIVFRKPNEDVLTTYLQDHWRAAFQRSSSNPQDRKGVGAWELEDTCRGGAAPPPKAFRPCAHRR